MDKLVFILYSCSDGLGTSRLLYYIYLLQKISPEFSFTYKLGASGLTSKSLDMYIDQLLSDDMVVLEDKILKPSSQGYDALEKMLLTLDCWDKLIWAESVFNGLSDDELYFICLTDFLISDVKSKQGVDGLISGEQNIKNILCTLSREYSDENFNSALEILRRLRL